MGRAVLLAAVAFVGGLGAAQLGRAESEDPYPSLGIFARVLGYIERSYVEAVPVERLVQAAIRGMVEELDGPSAYLDPDAFAALQAEARPEFGGVGIVLAEREQRAVLVEVHEETPAGRAGLQPGDVLIAVDETPVAGEPLTHIAERIVGAPGTTVTLGLESAADGSVFAVRLVRVRIYRSTVSTQRFGAFGYLRLVRFDERSARDLLRGLAVVSEGDALRGLVLDLRGNPGGVLKQAVAVSDMWLAKGAIVTTAGRNRRRETAHARKEGTQPGYPMAVLVDEGTASAAEIVAGALQDQSRARVFGQQTFGKGSVQTVIEMEDGSALRLTVARYLTPSGRSIDGRGIAPDQKVAAPGDRFRLGAPSRDPALGAALRWLSERTGRPFSPELVGTPGR